MLWSPADLADAAEFGLRAAADQLDLEQAVYGLDALDELRLHPILAAGFASAGYGVFREQRYPADRPKLSESHGERCDLVLTHDNRPLAVTGKAQTLFEPPDAAGFDDAFWLEIKVVSQFTIEGPNANYSSQLLSGVRHDVTKLSKDPGILHAGLLIVLFVHNHEIAAHDLRIWQERCLSRGLPIGAPSQRFIPVTDRMSNTIAAVSLFPVSHL